MPRILLIALTFLLMSATAQAQAPAWQRVTPSTGPADTTLLYATAVDGAGNVVVAGLLGGQGSTFGATTLVPQGRGGEGFVAKLSPTGQWLWAVAVSSPGDSPEEGIALFGVGVDAAGNVYVGGRYDDTLTLGSTTLLPIASGPPANYVAENAFVASLDPAGNWRWALACDPTTTGRAAVNGLSVDATGHAYVTGEYNGAVTFGSVGTLPNLNGLQQGFVARASAAGQWEWARALTSDGPNHLVQGLEIATDGAGSPVVMGDFEGTLQLGATALTAAAAGESLFVAKLTAAGQWEWATQADPGTGGFAVGYGLAVAPTGAVYVGGSLDGGLLAGTVALPGDGAFLAALSPQGQWQWGRVAGSTSFVDVCFGLAVEPVTGDVLATGSVGGPTAFDAATAIGQNGQTLYVARFSAAGAGRWALGGGDDRGFALALAVGPGGAVYVGGGFVGGVPVGFGPVTVPAESGVHSFVARLDQSVGLPDGTGTSAFTLAPNPARAAVRLVGAPAGPVTVFDALGRVVRTAAPGAEMLSVEGLPAGLYSVRAGEQVRRLVVK